MKFDFNDILLVPESFSSIRSRKEVNPYDENRMLPIMTAPMDTVVDIKNVEIFCDNRIYGVLPRNATSSKASINKRIFQSYGLEEFKDIFLKEEVQPILMDGEKYYALIDVANGHMEHLYDTAQEAKKLYGERLVLMVGNIANPKTFVMLAKLGVDYIRCGIGGGQGCLTSVQTGVGYPMASLINECYLLKKEHDLTTKIVADGGFKNFSDINKALALGADYVMLGSMLNKCFESCGEFVIKHDGKYTSSPENYVKILKSKRLPNNYTLEDYMKKGILYKKFRGMSTKEVQRDWGRTELKTSEGISKLNKVEYTVAGFVENLEDYLRSAMSYCDSYNLTDFKETEFELITPAAFGRFNK